MGQNNTAGRPAAGLALIAAKQKFGAEGEKTIALPVLIHLDCAKRGACTPAGAGFLVSHLIAAGFIAMRTKSHAFSKMVLAAYEALAKATNRPTEFLSLTTGEYRAIRAAIATYLRHIPNVELGVMIEAAKFAKGVMDEA